MLGLTRPRPRRVTKCIRPVDLINWHARLTDHGQQILQGCIAANSDADPQVGRDTFDAFDPESIPTTHFTDEFPHGHIVVALYPTGPSGGLLPLAEKPVSPTIRQQRAFLPEGFQLIALIIIAHIIGLPTGDRTGSQRPFE